MHPFCYLLCELCIYIFVISQYNCNTSKVVLYFSYILWNYLAFLSIKLSIYYKSSPSTSISAFLNSYILCFFPFRKMSFIQFPAFITNILFIWLNDYRFLLIHYTWKHLCIFQVKICIKVSEQPKKLSYRLTRHPFLYNIILIYNFKFYIVGCCVIVTCTSEIHNFFPFLRELHTEFLSSRFPVFSFLKYTNCLFVIYLLTPLQIVYTLFFNCFTYSSICRSF